MNRTPELLPSWPKRRKGWRRVTLTTNRHVYPNPDGSGWRWRTTRNMGPNKGEVLATGVARSHRTAMREADKVGVTL